MEINLQGRHGGGFSQCGSQCSFCKRTLYKFRLLEFKVTDAPLNMYRMVVTYENGMLDNIEVRQEIPQGGESRVIDLKVKD